MSKVYNVIGLEGCGHHGLEKVIINIINKYSNYIDKYELNNIILKHLSRNCDDFNIFENKIKEYLENKNYILYTDDSYPSGPSKTNKQQKNIINIYQIINKYANIKFIYLKRNIYNTINSHPEFNNDIIEHAQVIMRTKNYIEKQIEILREQNVDVYEINYEDIDTDNGYKIISDFINVSTEIVKTSVKKYFIPSQKNYTKLLDTQTIQSIDNIIQNNI